MQRYSTDCRYFANGICSKGNACSFAHDVSVRDENVCQFYLAGKCSYGAACRFKHTKPKNTLMEAPSTSGITQTPTAPRIRPIQLAKPGLNVGAPEFVPSWAKKPAVPAPITSYAAAAAASSSHSSVQNGESSSSAHSSSSSYLCPYHQKSGECTRETTGCPFVHGDYCDMCHQWSLHPFNMELRKLHQTECLASHTQEMERAFLLQKTEEKSCGICMENISEKNLRFGILNGCQHCFCLDCIRQWRTRDQESEDLATKTVRSCPECRQHSDYVIPSLFWVEAGQEKDLLIEMYKENTKSKVCKYYSGASNRGNCPFGNKCFYKHQLPDGSIDPGESPHARRRARLVDFLFNDDEDDESENSDDDPEFQRILREIAGNPAEGSFYRSLTAMISEFQTFQRHHRNDNSNQDN